MNFDHSINRTSIWTDRVRNSALEWKQDVSFPHTRHFLQPLFADTLVAYQAWYAAGPQQREAPRAQTGLNTWHKAHTRDAEHTCCYTGRAVVYMRGNFEGDARKPCTLTPSPPRACLAPARAS